MSDKQQQEGLEFNRQFGRGDWEEKLTFHHIFKIPKEHYYGTLGLDLTAQPVGAPLGNGAYRR